MRQTIVLTFDPQMGSFTVTANSSKILRDATFEQAVSHMASAVKQAQGDRAPEGLDAFILKATEENLAVALPIPEPVKPADAVSGTVIETEIPEQSAGESGTEKNEDEKTAPVETQPGEPEQPTPTPEPAPEQIQPESPTTVHDGEVAVAAT